MTRNDRICYLYAAGDLTMDEIGAEFGLSRMQIGRIIAAKGLVAMRKGPPKRHAVPHTMRKSFIGDANMTAEQLADAVARRVQNPQTERVTLILENGRIYAPTRCSETLDVFINLHPQLVVGCYARGVEAAAIAEDLECARGGA